MASGFLSLQADGELKESPGKGAQVAAREYEISTWERALARVLILSLINFIKNKQNKKYISFFFNLRFLVSRIS